MSIPYVITALAIIAVVTFVLRAAPFVALSKVADHPIVSVGRSCRSVSW